MILTCILTMTPYSWLQTLILLIIYFFHLCSQTQNIYICNFPETLHSLPLPSHHFFLSTHLSCTIIDFMSPTCALSLFCSLKQWCRNDRKNVNPPIFPTLRWLYCSLTSVVVPISLWAVFRLLPCILGAFPYLLHRPAPLVSTRSSSFKKQAVWNSKGCYHRKSVDTKNGY